MALEADITDFSRKLEEQRKINEARQKELDEQSKLLKRTGSIHAPIIVAPVENIYGISYSPQKLKNARSKSNIEDIIRDNDSTFNLAKLVQDAQEDKKEVYKEINEPIKISNDLVNKDDIGAQKNVLVDIISEDDEPEEKFERENNNLLSSILNAEGEGEELQCELPKNELPLLDNDFKENNDIKENDIKC